MKKVLFVFALLTVALGGFAQNAEETVVELMNGSIARGELVDAGDGQRLYIKTANGSTIYFTRRAVKEIANQRASATLRNFRNPVTVYLRNGSIITGQLTELQESDEMKIETPNRSTIYFTDKSVKEIVSGSAPAQRQRPETQDRQTASNERQTTTQREQTRQTQTREQPLAAVNEEAVVEPPRVKKYKGILEAGYTIKMGDLSKNRIEITTSHGYQINPSLFVGVGLGVNLYSDGFYKNDTRKFIEEATNQGYILGGHKDLIAGTVDSLNASMTIPIFADIRYNFMEGGQFIPFVGLKAGYSMGLLKTEVTTAESHKTETKVEGLGFLVIPSVGAKYVISPSLALNFSLGYAMQMFDYSYKDGGNIVTKSKNNGGISVKIGIEF